ncbi:MAG: hypothetical protein J5822_08720 [Eubacteriaceae bacterium]|nr:hypothetical protein [Eubacteriaceae bacterium]
MSNVIRANASSPAEEWLSMSNRGFECFLEVLLYAASGTEMTPSGKALTDALAELRELNDIAPGTASFDIDELPWESASLEDDVAFLTGIARKAAGTGTWSGLGYEPNMEILIPWLDRFSEMLGEMLPKTE